MDDALPRSGLSSWLTLAMIVATAFVVGAGAGALAFGHPRLAMSTFLALGYLVLIIVVRRDTTSQVAVPVIVGGLLLLGPVSAWLLPLVASACLLATLLAALIDLGVSRGQGYVLGQPCPVDELVTSLTAASA